MYVGCIGIVHHAMFIAAVLKMVARCSETDALHQISRYPGTKEPNKTTSRYNLYRSRHLQVYSSCACLSVEYVSSNVKNMKSLKFCPKSTVFIEFLHNQERRRETKKSPPGKFIKVDVPKVTAPEHA